MSTGCGKTAACAVAGMVALSAVAFAQSQEVAREGHRVEAPEGSLVRVARQSTSHFKDNETAVAAGYELSSGCVSGPEQGAMGVHFVNAALVGDGMLDAAQPEALVYEPRDDEFHLVAVEYIVLAEQWDAGNSHPPILNGQHFHYVPAPNRAGLDAHYELHVWAWKSNPHGAFADWNPRVRCHAYSPQ